MDIFLQLPIEIIRKIIPYTYNPQPKNLQMDIIDYQKNIGFIKELYIRFWGEIWNYTPADSMCWLENDLVSYVNDYQALTTGYTDKFYSIFMRHNQLKSREKVNRFYKYKFYNPAENENVVLNIHFIFGLLTIEERGEFISSFLDFDNNFNNQTLINTILHG